MHDTTAGVAQSASYRASGVGRHVLAGIAVVALFVWVGAAQLRRRLLPGGPL